MAASDAHDGRITNVRLTFEFDGKPHTFTLDDDSPWWGVWQSMSDEDPYLVWDRRALPPVEPVPCSYTWMP